MPCGMPITITIALLRFAEGVLFGPPQYSLFDDVLHVFFFHLVFEFSECDNYKFKQFCLEFWVCSCSSKPSTIYPKVSKILYQTTIISFLYLFSNSWPILREIGRFAVTFLGFTNIDVNKANVQSAEFSVRFSQINRPFKPTRHRRNTIILGLMDSFICYQVIYDNIFSICVSRF